MTKGTGGSFCRFGSVSEQVDICRRKAAACEQAAGMATKANVRAKYASFAGQWREMAEQAEELEERRLALLRRLSTLSVLPRTCVVATSTRR